MKKSLDKVFEFKNRTVDAILLAFSPEAPIKFDYYIPDKHKIVKIVVGAMGNICGFKEKAYTEYPHLQLYHNLQNLRAIEPRILKGLKEVYYKADRDSHSFIEDYMSYSGYQIGSEWFIGIGNIFRFRPGERELALKKFCKYWTNKEQQDYQKIWREMRKEHGIALQKLKER